MTENQPKKQFAEDLVSHDKEVSQFDFGGFRMNLEKTLESIERHRRSVRRASLIASAVTIAILLLFIPAVAVANIWRITWPPVVVGSCFYSSLIVAAVLLLLHQHKYKPAVDRARSELQIAMIADLQRQVAALSQRLADRNR